MAAWRARAFHLTRSRAFLGKVVAVILGASMLIALLVHALRDDNPRSRQFRTGSDAAGVSRAFESHVRDGYAHLLALKNPAPADLADWLRDTAGGWRTTHAETVLPFDGAALRLGNLELDPVLARHTSGSVQREIFVSFTRCCFLPEGEPRQLAWQALERISATVPAPRFAHEFRGDLFVREGRTEDALQAWMKEAVHDDARHSRKLAVEAALSLPDVDALRRLCSDGRVIDEMGAITQWQAAKMLGDKSLLMRAMLALHWERWMQTAAVPVALLAAGVWYVILVFTGSRERNRWLRYLPPVLAGVASVWLLQWWQGTLRYRSSPEEEVTMTREIFHWVMYVGVPEELAKMCLFAFFLPVLLHHRSDVKAALTAGCVGLGFALEENLHYFMNYGPGVAVGRLLTANVMHVVLTGLVGWHLYELVRSRFHHATEFLIVFCGAAAAHGIYDFSAGEAAGEWGMDVLGIVILAVGTRLYFKHLQGSDGLLQGMTISRTAVFCVGTASLVGTLMIVAVWQQGTLTGMTAVLKNALGLAVVALFYVREFREV